MELECDLRPAELEGRLESFFELARGKTLALAKRWQPDAGAPVFTQQGQYTARGWTEWTQGFQFGIQILLFDALGDEALLKLGRDNTDRYMPPHLSHMGVHDHGFNTVSTYGNLWRLAHEGRSNASPEAVKKYALAIKLSGAVQAMRWTELPDGAGYIHSFNGPHSLFSDTIRSLRALVLADGLGHALCGENDRRISLLERAVRHLETTARYNVYFGEGRDHYDIRGRVVHESIFNTKDGQYRCPSTQQGYSPFTTWTRGLGWILLGAAELLEYFEALPDDTLEVAGDPATIRKLALDTARATADFYIAQTPLDGIPYWDTGAPGLSQMGDYLQRPAEPDNLCEPVDSSAAAISAQGFLRLGQSLGEEGAHYTAAGLTVAKRLFEAPYLSTDPAHEGLLLHSIYHRPNGWDYVPEGKAIPQGESSMWGDYHAMELAVYLKRQLKNEPYLSFWSPLKQ